LISEESIRAILCSAFILLENHFADVRQRQEIFTCRESVDQMKARNYRSMLKQTCFQTISYEGESNNRVQLHHQFAIVRIQLYRTNMLLHNAFIKIRENIREL